MTLPAGQISLSEVNVELNLSPTATISLNDAAVRSLAGVPSGAIAMSNLQGKSNNPFFFGSLYPSTVSGQQILADSSGNIYQQNILGPGSSKAQVIKINNTGVIQWQRQVTSPSLDYPSVNSVGMALDSSSNTYAAGLSGNNIYIWKYNSSGTLQWQKKLGDDVNTTYIGGTGVGTLAIDSGGNLVLVMANIGNRIGAMKVNSSGATQWQSQMSPSGLTNTQADCIATDSSSNVYFAGYSYDSGFSLTLGKFDSSGTAQWLRRGANAEFFGGWGRGVGTDSSGNVYVASLGSSSTTILLKYDSSGTNLWATRFALGATGDNTPASIAVDSSGNSYIFGRGGTEGYFVVKYNSSGTIQWQRSVVASAGSYMVAVGIGLSADGATFYINGRDNASSTSLFAKLPTDGSKTGTFTVNGATYTYAATSLAVSASNLTLSSVTPNGGSFSRANTTSSFTDSASTRSIAVTNV